LAFNLDALADKRRLRDPGWASGADAGTDTDQ
jgi:hypothetical protein